MTAMGPGNGNQRVRNAEILAAIKHLEGKFDDLSSKVEENHEDVKAACEHTTRCSERWEAHKDAHATVDARLDKAESSAGWKAAIGTSIAAGVAALYSILEK